MLNRHFWWLNTTTKSAVFPPTSPRRSGGARRARRHGEHGGDRGILEVWDRTGEMGKNYGKIYGKYPQKIWENMAKNGKIYENMAKHGKNLGEIILIILVQYGNIPRKCMGISPENMAKNMVRLRTSIYKDPF